MAERANERVAWFNGEFMPENQVRIPFRDMSWTYGDGCFDMTRSFNHKLFKVKEHVDRLYRSLKYLRIDPGLSPERMTALTEELFEHNRHSPLSRHPCPGLIWNTSLYTSSGPVWYHAPAVVNNG